MHAFCPTVLWWAALLFSACPPTVFPLLQLLCCPFQQCGHALARVAWLRTAATASLPQFSPCILPRPHTHLTRHLPAAQLLGALLQRVAPTFSCPVHLRIAVAGRTASPTAYYTLPVSVPTQAAHFGRGSPLPGQPHRYHLRRDYPAVACPSRASVSCALLLPAGPQSYLSVGQLILPSALFLCCAHHLHPALTLRTLHTLYSPYAHAAHTLRTHCDHTRHTPHTHCAHYTPAQASMRHSCAPGTRQGKHASLRCALPFFLISLHHYTLAGATRIHTLPSGMECQRAHVLHAPQPRPRPVGWGCAHTGTLPPSLQGTRCPPCRGCPALHHPARDRTLCAAEHFLSLGSRSPRMDTPLHPAVTLTISLFAVLAPS